MIRDQGEVLYIQQYVQTFRTRRRLIPSTTYQNRPIFDHPTCMHASNHARHAQPTPRLHAARHTSYVSSKKTSPSVKGNAPHVSRKNRARQSPDVTVYQVCSAPVPPRSRLIQIVRQIPSLICRAARTQRASQWVRYLRIRSRIEIARTKRPTQASSDIHRDLPNDTRRKYNTF